MERNKYKTSSVENIERKIKHYCAYQERSHFEVREKLYALGLYKAQVEMLMAQLIEEDHLNEERFAKSFARGHFRLKKWGRIKIKYELQAKRVSTYNIKTGIKEISEDDYQATLQKLATDKWALLKHEQYLTRQAKTMAYLMQKGYEAALAQQAIKSIKDK